LASALLEQTKISCYTEYKAFEFSLIYNTCTLGIFVGDRDRKFNFFFFYRDLEPKRFKTLLYIGVSQPFGLQVPVEDKFLHYCLGHNFLLSFCPSSVLLIVVFLLQNRPGCCKIYLNCIFNHLID